MVILKKPFMVRGPQSKLCELTFAFIGVFDGHNGSAAAEYTAKNLYQVILNQKYTEQPKAVLEASFKRLNNDFLSTGIRGGTTAICALIMQKTIYVCNVGDSRAILCRGGKAIALSEDHKCTREDEKKRIEKLGGRIIHYCGTWRVDGCLNMTRAIGNRDLQPYVIADPEIQEHSIQPEDKFLILVSDGVLEKLSNQDTCDLAKSCKNVQEASQKITDHALKMGSCDNITTLVIDLQHYQ